MEKHVVIISGASGSIGKAISEKFYNSESNLNLLCNTNKELLKDFSCNKYSGDMTNADYIEEVTNKIDFSKRFININCIGITIDKLITRISEEDFLKVIKVNLKSIFLLTRGIIKKAKNGGHFINVSSISGVTGRIGQTSYSASKGGLISFTKSIAKEYGKRDIQANVILPGFIPSHITGRLKQDKIDLIKSSHVLNRFQNVNEVSDFVYNLSNMRNVSGQVFNLDSRIY